MYVPGRWTFKLDSASVAAGSSQAGAHMVICLQTEMN